MPEHSHSTSVAPPGRDDNFRAYTMKVEIDEFAVHGQVVNPERSHAVRQHRSIDVHFLASALDADAQSRLQQPTPAAGMQPDTALDPAREAAVEFGQSHAE
jgi:hypothetical protein